MALLDRAADVVDRIAHFWIDRHIARERRRLMGERGFAVVSYWDELPAFQPTRQQIDALHRSGRLEDLQPIIEAARASGAVLGNGRGLHHMAWEYFRRPMHQLRTPAECDAALPAFRAAWERARTPFAAALYANALDIAAFAHRGAAFAGEVGHGQWAAFGDRLAIAEQVLAETEAAAGDCPIWRQVHYDHGLDGPIAASAFLERFERVWALDRHDIDLCVSHGIRLMPRWRGNDAQDVEAFARRAAALTQDRFGWGLYAQIYWGQSGMGSHEIEDTACDRDLVKQGFEDLAARFPAQSVLNHYAATMFWIGDNPACFALFDRRIEAIVPSAWQEDSDAEGVDAALDAFVAAQPEEA